MNGLFRPRNLAIVGGLAGAVYVVPSLMPNVFETQGTKNIGDRWSVGGGSNTHTPGVATKRGMSVLVMNLKELN